MHAALVRLSSVVALTVPLAAHPVLALAVPEHQQVTVGYASQSAGPVTDVGPQPEARDTVRGRHGGDGRDGPLDPCRGGAR